MTTCCGSADGTRVAVVAQGGLTPNAPAGQHELFVREILSVRNLATGAVQKPDARRSRWQGGG